MKQNLSKYKLRKLATEALRNGIRLHFDAILLYNSSSYPSALQLSIIAMEEIAKAKIIENYYFKAVTNKGFQIEEFEQQWLQHLYYHPRKQFRFMGHDLWEYSPKFVRFVEQKSLETLKQNATYVGLKKNGKQIDTNSRISVPHKINSSQPKKIISMVNDELIEMCKLNAEHEYHFWIDEMDAYIDGELLKYLQKWTPKSGLRSPKWVKVWQKMSKK